jgi:hypothetical protein
MFKRQIAFHLAWDAACQSAERVGEGQHPAADRVKLMRMALEVGLGKSDKMAKGE